MDRQHVKPEINLRDDGLTLTTIEPGMCGEPSWLPNVTCQRRTGHAGIHEAVTPDAPGIIGWRGIGGGDGR